MRQALPCSVKPDADDAAIAGASGLDAKTPAKTDTAINFEMTANRALAYQAEQKKAGIEVNFTTAINHILKEVYKS